MKRFPLFVVLYYLLNPSIADAQKFVTVDFTGTIDLVADPGTPTYPADRIVVGAISVKMRDAITGTFTYDTSPLSLIKSNNQTGLYAFTEGPTGVSININGINLKTSMNPPMGGHNPQAKIAVVNGQAENPNDEMNFFYHQIKTSYYMGRPLPMEATKYIEFRDHDGRALSSKLLPENISIPDWPTAFGNVLFSIPTPGQMSEYNDMPSEIAFTIQSWSSRISHTEGMITADIAIK